MKCENCSEPLNSNFCPACGQKNVNLSRPLPELLAEVVTETFDLDGRAARTLKLLFFRPGQLTHQYLQGQRKKFTPPFRLYLIISVVFFIGAAWIAERGVLLTGDQTLGTDAPQQARFVAEDLPKLMFLLLPAFAGLLKLAFRDRLYFDHLIHSLHIHCAAYLILALMLPFEQSASSAWPIMLLQLALMGYWLWYFYCSVRVVYAEGWFATLMKATALTFAYLMLVAGAFEAASYLSIGEAQVRSLTD